MRKLRFIECSDGTKVHVGDKVHVQCGNLTIDGVIEDICSDLRSFKLRCGEHTYLCSSRTAKYLIERKKKDEKSSDSDAR